MRPKAILMRVLGKERARVVDLVAIAVVEIYWEYLPCLAVSSRVSNCWVRLERYLRLETHDLLGVWYRIDEMTNEKKSICFRVEWEKATPTPSFG
jgi:hypothetical protein